MFLFLSSLLPALDHMVDVYCLCTLVFAVDAVCNNFIVCMFKLSTESYVFVACCSDVRQSCQMCMTMQHSLVVVLIGSM